MLKHWLMKTFQDVNHALLKFGLLGVVFLLNKVLYEMLDAEGCTLLLKLVGACS